jgi:GAF domain-containing protein
MLDQSSAQQTSHTGFESSGNQPTANVLETSPDRSSQASISAALAAVKAKPVPNADIASPFRAGGPARANSVAHLAERDLDAALQLLAERAQYITEAEGAVIALRRKGRNDMLCRASAGEKAPALGALLSTEAGLSGESVRTRLALRCDDAEHDSRVNREGCRELGIASVVVMPVVGDDQVLGVFELFSGHVNAFDERDFSALQRLSRMVEAAVTLSAAAQTFPTETAPDARSTPLVQTQPEPAENVEAIGAVAACSSSAHIEADFVPAIPERSEAPRKPLLWSAAQDGNSQAMGNLADQSHVPPILRNLRKCEACGFPVSESRTLCVECEEKQWRGQLRTRPVAELQVGRESANAQVRPVPGATAMAAAASAAASDGAVQAFPTVTSTAVQRSDVTVETAESVAIATQSARKDAAILFVPGTAEAIGKNVANLPRAEPPLFVAGVAESESWLSANKYILASVAIVGTAIAIVLIFR